MDCNLDRRALIVVEQSDQNVRLVASLTRSDRCALAATLDPTSELRIRSAHVLSRLLSQDGFYSRVVVGARGAFRELSFFFAPSVLVVDLDKQGRWMRVFVRQARALHPEMPILMMASGDGPLVGEVVQGPLALLRKPVDYAELSAKLKVLGDCARGSDGVGTEEAATRP